MKMSKKEQLPSLNKIIVYGLGAMGRPIARNLHEHNLLIGVKNRTQGIADALANELNLSEFESDEEMFKAADCVLTCVAADQDLWDIINEFKGLLNPNAVVIDCSTVSSETAKNIAIDLNEMGIEFMDAPVSGGVEGAKKGTLSIMVGANLSTYKRANDLFHSIGSQVTFMGKVGQGQATKAVNQMLVAGVAQAVCETLAYAEKCNLPIEKTIEVLSAGAAGNWFLDKRGRTMCKDEFKEGFKLALLHKDLKICQKSLSDMGTESQLVEKGIHEYQQLIDRGLGDFDISALIKLKREQLQIENGENDE
jgi:3-hydroxyisobutyrate dehydrogenase